MPPMSPPLAVNPRPLSLDAGPAGKIYITGALSGLGMAQSNPVAGDRRALTDISNAQIFVQKTDGPVQFFVQAGAYSMPALGASYLAAGKTTDATFGWAPQAYVKFVPTNEFSIQVGKLPTLIGAESTFSFENMNIERGLLWGQENAVNQGVQANYAVGPLAVSASINDGFYSNRFSWVTGSLSYSFSPADVLLFSGGGNTRQTRYSSSATPLALNNESIFNFIYTHTQGPWTIQPYIQYTEVPKAEDIGIAHGASTIGGALLVNYTFPPVSAVSRWSLPVRLEYIASSGSIADAAPNLIYGPGSGAWSVTVTPTFQYQRVFIRTEVSFVNATHSTPGYVFGTGGQNRSQTRGLIETGVLF